MTDSPRWPLRFGYFRLLGCGMSFAALLWFAHLWRGRAEPLQAFYLPEYVRSYVDIPFWHSYDVVMYGNRLAASGDSGPFTVQTLKLDREKWNAWLRENVYDDRPLWSVLRWPLVGLGAMLIILAGFGTVADRRINGAARNGRLIRGPRVVSHWRWNLRSLGKQRDFWVETE